MKVELIPVVEINIRHEVVPMPEGKDWLLPKQRAKYYQEVLDRRGFGRNVKPYLKGYPLYEPSKLSHIALKKLLTQHVEWVREVMAIKGLDKNEALALDGGFVLRVNGKDKLYPQCCGDLADIAYWEKIANRIPAQYKGHPVPVLEFRREKVRFDLHHSRYKEAFNPPCTDHIVEIDLFDLNKAVKQAKGKLEALGKRVKAIDKEEKWGIEDIEKMLIWQSPDL